MLLMDTIAEIRRRHLVSRESISSIARGLKLSRPTVRKHCRTQREPVYRREKQPTPRLGEFQERLETWLRTERLLPKAQRRTARRLFEGLQAEGYRGAYDSVQRFVQRWKAAKSGPSLAHAFVALAFAPGKVCQFDWSHEPVELNGVMQTLKVAHFRLTGVSVAVFDAMLAQLRDPWDAQQARKARSGRPLDVGGLEDHLLVMAVYL